METINEKKVAFLSTPRFLRKLVSPSAAELFALLKYKRDHLVENNYIRNNQSWFYYTMADMKEDLVYPNATNSIKKLLRELEAVGILKSEIKSSPFRLKEFQIDDGTYDKLAKENGDIWKRVKN